jgi:hypothetical protein
MAAVPGNGDFSNIDQFRPRHMQTQQTSSAHITKHSSCQITKGKGQIVSKSIADQRSASTVAVCTSLDSNCAH